MTPTNQIATLINMNEVNMNSHSGAPQ
jgi:hypothetical protein